MVNIFFYVMLVAVLVSLICGFATVSRRLLGMVLGMGACRVAILAAGAGAVVLVALLSVASLVLTFAPAHSRESPLSNQNSPADD